MASPVSGAVEEVAQVAGKAGREVFDGLLRRVKVSEGVYDFSNWGNTIGDASRLADRNVMESHAGYRVGQFDTTRGMPIVQPARPLDKLFERTAYLAESDFSRYGNTIGDASSIVPGRVATPESHPIVAFGAAAEPKAGRIPFLDSPPSGGGGGPSPQGSPIERAVASAPGKGSFSFMGLAGGSIMGGAAGYELGDKDAKSFAIGAVAGASLGGFARPLIEKGLEARSSQVLARATEVQSTDAVMAAKLREGNAKLLKFQSSLNTQEGRYTAFASGSMLAGGTFGAMFGGGNRTNQRSGFNSNRGNTF